MPRAAKRSGRPVRGSGFNPDSADQLRGEDRRTIASITNAVARQADQAGTYLRRIDARTMRKDLEDITRRRPSA